MKIGKALLLSFLFPALVLAGTDSANLNRRFGRGVGGGGGAGGGVAASAPDIVGDFVRYDLLNYPPALGYLFRQYGYFTVSHCKGAGDGWITPEDNMVGASTSNVFTASAVNLYDSTPFRINRIEVAEEGFVIDTSGPAGGVKATNLLQGGLLTQIANAFTVPNAARQFRVREVQEADGTPHLQVFFRPFWYANWSTGYILGIGSVQCLLSEP